MHPQGTAEKGEEDYFWKTRGRASDNERKTLSDSTAMKTFAVA